MKLILRLLVAGFVFVLLPGCMEVETVVRVHPDGSGIVREQILVSKTVVESMRAMAEGFARFGGGEKDSDVDLLNERELRKNASRMGEGVYLISAKKVVTASGEGYKAYYGFRDINKLRVNQNPGDKTSSDPGTQIQQSGQKEEFITFELVRGSPVELIIRTTAGEDINLSPGSRDHAGPPPDMEIPLKDDPEAQLLMTKMKEMFKGFRVAMAVEVIGEIIETNATHRDGTRITLMELDFEKLLDAPEKFREFARRQPRLQGHRPGLLSPVQRLHRHMQQQLVAGPPCLARPVRQVPRIGEERQGQRVGQIDRPLGAGEVQAQVVDHDGNHRAAPGLSGRRQTLPGGHRFATRVFHKRRHGGLRLRVRPVCRLYR